MKKWNILFVLILLSSCAWFKNIQEHTKELKPYLNEKQVYLIKDVRMTVTRGLFNEKHEFLLRKGKYISILKSSKGIYYLSPKDGIYKLTSRHKGLSVGGMYIDNDDNNYAYLWVWPLRNENRNLLSPSPSRPLSQTDVQPEWFLLQTREFLTSTGKGFYNKPWIDMDFRLDRKLIKVFEESESTLHH